MAPLIEVRHLSKAFRIRGYYGSQREVRAVDNVSFDIHKGETFGLVGESGCGKTTLGRTVTRLYEPSSGEILFDGKDIASLKSKELAPYRRRIQSIFQDPYSSLNPYMNVEELIGEPLDLTQRLSKAERREQILDMLLRVGLDADDLEKYPHEFSGGQRQRIGIARALVTRPEFVLCDEPISALDVSIQAQVVNLLEDLQQELGLTYLFVAHDLSMVRHISDCIAVMHLGNIVEISPARELYRSPLHPYTQALLSAIPIPDPKKARENKRIHLNSDIPSVTGNGHGCTFAPRCPYARPECFEQKPKLQEVSPGHEVACIL